MSEMEDWRDNEELTTEKDGEEYPARMSLLGNMADGDKIVLEFYDNGELITDREHGNNVVAFEVGVVSLDLTRHAYTWEDEIVEEGMRLFFETGSNPLLSKLSDIETEGQVLEIVKHQRDRYDVEYGVSIVDQSEQ
jgi:hypothetical protein